MSDPQAEKAALRPSQELVTALDQLSSIASRELDRKAAMREAAETACRFLRSEACAILATDIKAGYAEYVACAGNKELARYLCERRARLAGIAGVPTSGRGSLELGEPVERYDLFDEGFVGLLPQVARQCKVNAVLGWPLRNERGAFGYLLHFANAAGSFSSEEIARVELLARHTASTLDRLEDVASRRRLQWLNQMMQRLAEAESESQVLALLVEVGTGFLRAPHASAALLRPNGELAIIQGESPRADGGAHGRSTLLPGQGIANVALIREEPVLVDDVRDLQWASTFVEVWSDTHSELAVPIVLSGAAVRRGTSLARASRRFGVLNFESPAIGAFTRVDADLFWSLVRYGAVLFDRLETERKQRELAAVHQEILGKTDWNQTIDVMMQAISKLGYPYVNISLVRQDIGRIRTEYVMGILPGEMDRFIQLADHPLDSKDIQADIVRNRQIEAPAPDDSRLDPAVVETFRQQDLMRVYLPMIAPSDNRVIGTLEAGFKRGEHRQHIYEEDVQILKAFIDYAAYALDKRQAYVLDKIGHEFRAPVAGIRNNARFLQRHIEGMRPQLIQNKLDDVITDCEILLSQLARLEHILGKASPQPKLAPTLVFRDVVVKTLRQLMPELTRQGLDPAGFKYDPSDIPRLGVLWVDKARLSQVFLNLITNCIKYADTGDKFEVRVELEDAGAAWQIHIKDLGIGVKPEYADRIFHDGFRTPEARACNPTGSGLGLTISRQIMKEIGGDLTLSQMYKPTEFVVRLPKSLARKPKENRNDPNG